MISTIYAHSRLAKKTATAKKRAINNFYYPREKLTKDLTGAKNENRIAKEIQPVSRAEN